MTDTPSSIDTTDGTLFDGAVRFAQPSEGYRAAVDGLLLAYFAPAARKLAVDLGAGAGMVSLALLAHGRAPRLAAIEGQPALASVLRKNLEANGWGTPRTRVEVGSVDQIARSLRGSADLVVANPPFYSHAASTGGTDPLAETSLRASDPLGPFVRAARVLLGRAGRACWIFPARDLEPLLAALASKDLHPRRIAFVHPRSDAPATRVLVESSVGRPGGLAVEPSWVLFEPGLGGGERESTLLRAASRERPSGLSTDSQS